MPPAAGCRRRSGRPRSGAARRARRRRRRGRRARPRVVVPGCTISRSWATKSSVTPTSTTLAVTAPAPAPMPPATSIPTGTAEQQAEQAAPQRRRRSPSARLQVLRLADVRLAVAVLDDEHGVVQASSRSSRARRVTAVMNSTARRSSSKEMAARRCTDPGSLGVPVDESVGSDTSLMAASLQRRARRAGQDRSTIASTSSTVSSRRRRGWPRRARPSAAAGARGGCVPADVDERHDVEAAGTGRHRRRRPAADAVRPRVTGSPGTNPPLTRSAARSAASTSAGCAVARREQRQDLTGGAQPLILDLHLAGEAGRQPVDGDDVVVGQVRERTGRQVPRHRLP